MLRIGLRKINTFTFIILFDLQNSKFTYHISRTIFQNDLFLLIHILSMIMNNK